MRGSCMPVTAQHYGLEFGLTVNKAYSVLVGMRLTRGLDPMGIKAWLGAFRSITFFVETKLSLNPFRRAV